MSYTANFATAITDLRRVGTHGGNLTQQEIRNIQACILSKAAVDTANTTIAVQTGILTGIGGASATASTAIIAAMATLVAAMPGTVAANAPMDGSDT